MEAAKRFRLALEIRPKSGYILIQLARATGEKQDYIDLLEAWKEADGNRPELTEAQNAVAE